MIYYAKVQSPIGQLTLCGDGQALTVCIFPLAVRRAGLILPGWKSQSIFLALVSSWKSILLAFGSNSTYNSSRTPHPFKAKFWLRCKPFRMARCVAIKI